jgi:hypothetical protein
MHFSEDVGDLSDARVGVNSPDDVGEEILFTPRG